MDLTRPPRDFVDCHINGVRHRITGSAAMMTLSDYLRDRCRLTGTKIVCAEGDCGACSVLLGRVNPRRVNPPDPTDVHGEATPTRNYHSVDSCIVFMHQLDGVHIVTVEGLASGPRSRPVLSAVQQAMVDGHGSQCGFCTPGFVVAMHGLLEEHAPDDVITEDQWRVGLSGNLCRCTGYVQIVRAAQSIAAGDVQTMETRYPAAMLLPGDDARWNDPILITHQDETVYVPSTIEQAIAFKHSHNAARLITGATDVGVQNNHGHHPGRFRLCLSRIDELRTITPDDHAITLGAAATWTDVLAAVAKPFPEWFHIIERFGSPQIRNIGTLGGNLANASPIADSLPFLYAIDATLRLVSVRGSRDVSVRDFYRGYKQTELLTDEIIHSVRCPMPRSGEHLKLYKISKRRDMDISTVAAAIALTIVDGEITDASVALGGVGPTVVMAESAQSHLRNREWSAATMRRAGELAAASITPIDDVRGSADYRRLVTHNLFEKCFHDLDRIVGHDSSTQVPR